MSYLIEQLRQFVCVTPDGDVVNKEGRVLLQIRKWIDRRDGLNFITSAGIMALLREGKMPEMSKLVLVDRDELGRAGDVEKMRGLEQAVERLQGELSGVYRWIESRLPDGFQDSRSYAWHLDEIGDRWTEKEEAAKDEIQQLLWQLEEMGKERDEAINIQHPTSNIQHPSSLHASDGGETDALIGGIFERDGEVTERNCPEAWVKLARKLERERDAGRAEVERLKAIIEGERARAAAAVGAIRKEMDSRSWLESGGHGSIEFDDDQWYAEFADAMNGIRRELDALRPLIRDWSDCPNQQTGVDIGREVVSLQAEVERLKAELVTRNTERGQSTSNVQHSTSNVQVQPLARLVVGVTGNKGHGKDTLARAMSEAAGGVAVIHFADALKQIVRRVFRLTEEHTDGHLKEVRFDRPIHVDQYLQPLRDATGLFLKPLGLVAESPRRLMQMVGTEYVRGIQDDYWVSRVREEIVRRGGRAIVADVRFPNEVAMLREIGALMVRVRRDDVAVDATHASESQVDAIPVDAIVLNRAGELGHLQEMARVFVLGVQQRRTLDTVGKV